MGLFCAHCASENSSALWSQNENSVMAGGTEQQLPFVMSACIEKSEETDWFSGMRKVPMTVYCDRRSAFSDFMPNSSFTF